MDEDLYQDWLDEQVDDVQVALLHNGLDGLFHSFVDWLKEKGHLKEK